MIMYNYYVSIMTKNEIIHKKDNGALFNQVILTCVNIERSLMDRASFYWYNPDYYNLVDLSLIDIKF